MCAISDKLRYDQMSSHLVSMAILLHYLILLFPPEPDSILKVDHFFAMSHFAKRPNLRMPIVLCLLTSVNSVSQNVVP